MAFSYEDYLLYTKAPKVDAKLFATISAGVIALVEDIYKIKLENNPAYVITYFNRAESDTINVPIYPLNSITSITHDGDPVTYTYYGDDVEVTTSITNYRIPFVITCDAGFATVPDDLKHAIYSHMEHEYFRYKNSIDSVQKVINTSGNTTYFRENNIPKPCQVIYDYYSPRQVIL